MSTVNNAIDAATASQTFGGPVTFTNSSVTMSALPSATTSNSLFWNSTSGVITQGVASGGGGFTSINVQKFTTNGTYTPTSGMVYCIIEAVAGGGGGGGLASATGAGNAGPGGSGGYARLLASAATIGASQSITVGAAGSGGASTGTNGSAGGNTAVGSLISCTGGGGGAFGNIYMPSTTTGLNFTTGGTAGTATGGNLNIAGQAGTASNTLYTGNANAYLVMNGVGGSTPLGSGGTVSSTQNNILNNASGYGSGGYGASVTSASSGVAGGNGAPGVAIITEFIG